MRYRLYILSPHVFKRLCNSHSEDLRCRSCDRLLGPGMMVYSKESMGRVRLRCLECAIKFNLVDEKEVSLKILEMNDRKNDSKIPIVTKHLYYR